MEAKNIEATETLKNGVAVTIRAIRPADKAMLAVFSRSGLSMKQSVADGVVHVTLSLA